MLRSLALLMSMVSCVPDGKAPIYTNLQTGLLGGACVTDGDCKTPGMSCNRTTFTGYKLEAPDGYCTMNCSVDAECTPGKCVAGGDGKRYCGAFCDHPGNCRVNYVCDAVDNYCEPAGFFNFSCDPSLGSGVCTLTNGSQGGCLRAALGSGLSGYCAPACILGGSCPMGQGCHYFDVTRVGKNFKNDAFKGLLCFKEPTAPAPVGGTCRYNSDCVSSVDCVTVGGGTPVCHADCLPGNTCSDGSSCADYTPRLPSLGYCP